MPRTVKTKTKHLASLPSPTTSKPKIERPEMDKSTLIAILMARLGDNRSFDWHELSLKMKFTVEDTGKGGKVKGKRSGGKVKEEERTEISGTELHDIYYNIILPSLRRGEMPWERESTSSTSTCASAPSPVSNDVPNAKDMHAKQSAKPSISKSKRREPKRNAETDEESMEEYESEEDEWTLDAQSEEGD